MKPKKDLGEVGLVGAKLLVKVMRGLLIHQYKSQMGYKNQNNLHKVGNKQAYHIKSRYAKHVITKIKSFTSQKAGHHGIS